MKINKEEIKQLIYTKYESIRDYAEATGQARSSLYLYMKRGEFPDYLVADLRKAEAKPNHDENGVLILPRGIQ